MDLKKFLPGLDKSEKEEFYWALTIEPGWVQAGIWKITGNSAEVTFTSQPVAWEMESELVNAADTVLSTAIQNFPQDAQEPTKTVFGVSYSWIKEGEISPDHLDKIKKICTDLSLVPVGFVVMAEAIAHLIKSETGTPVNSIVLGIYKQNLELSLFEKGKLIGTTQIARSVSLVEDVIEGLTRLSTGEILPSGMLVYDGREGDLEDARQELLKVDWETYGSLKFLHSPKIELVDYQRKIFAVSLAGASELAGVTNLIAKTIPEIETENKTIVKEIQVEPKKSEANLDGISPEEMGFEVMKEHNMPDPPELTSEHDLGMIESNVVSVPESNTTIKTKAKGLLNTSYLENIKVMFSGFVNNFSKFKVAKPSFSAGPKPFAWGVFFLLLIATLAGLFWWFAPKATVTIYLSPRKLEESIELTVDTEISESDFSSKMVSGKVIETNVSGEKTTQTTGTKTVGDKSTGKVKIYRVGPQISLNPGTFINGPNSLKFVVDNQVLVASGSASTPGETEVSVSAQDIGAEYNLASGTTFSVGNYSTSDMEAKNSSAFSGGNSRQTKAVSKSDQEGLQKDLSGELTDSAEDELLSKITDDDFLIKESIVSKVISSDYDRKVGDEAESVGLNLDLGISGIVVNKSDLSKLSEAILTGKVSDGFIMSTDQINYSFGEFKEDNGKYKFDLKVVANLLPNVNVDDVKSKITGRQIQIAKDYLQTSIPAFTRVEIKIKPVFPGKLKTLPHVEKNIEVQFSSER